MGTGNHSIFYNPILPEGNPDPWIVHSDGFYYYCGSDEGRRIFIIRSKTLTGIGRQERTIVWTPPECGTHSRSLWAPELHWIGDRWYIYYAADDGHNENHRMYVLQSETSDPCGLYTHCGKMTDSTDRWAIDGTIMQLPGGRMYFVWSGWEGDVNIEQNLYIAAVNPKRPWEVVGERVLISRPEFDWERVGVPYVNEGPQVLLHSGRVLIIYSASGSWTGDYCLGMLRADANADPLRPESWHKHHLPVFARDDHAQVYGVGHASFVRSPDGTEDWIAYHAMSSPDGGWAGRSVRIQRFTWSEDGLPVFGKPLATTIQLNVPAGEPDDEYSS